MWKVEPIFIVYNFPCLYEQYLFNLSSLLTLFLLFINHNKRVKRICIGGGI